MSDDCIQQLVSIGLQHAEIRKSSLITSKILHKIVAPCKEIRGATACPAGILLTLENMPGGVHGIGLLESNSPSVKVIHRFDKSWPVPRCLLFVPQVSTLIVGAAGVQVCWFTVSGPDVTFSKLTSAAHASQATCTSTNMNKDGTRIAVTYTDGCTAIYDFDTLVRTLEHPSKSGCYSCCFIPNGVVTGHRKDICIWTDQGLLSHTISPHAGIIWDIHLFNGCIISSSNDTTVKSHSLGTWTLTHEWQMPGPASKLLIDGNTLYVSILHKGVASCSLDASHAQLLTDHPDDVNGLFIINGPNTGPLTSAISKSGSSTSTLPVSSPPPMQSRPMPTGPLSGWTEDDVYSWILSVPAIAECAAAFKKFGIHGKVLVKGLTEAHFDEMNILSGVVRSRILAEVEQAAQGIRSWNVSQVRAWMQQIELPAVVVDCFVANGINGSLIAAGISDDDLLEMGINSSIQRRVALSALRSLIEN